MIYKALLTLFQKYNILVADAYQFKHFVAAFIGGLLIFGKENKINEQVRHGIWQFFLVETLLELFMYG